MVTLAILNQTSYPYNIRNIRVSGAESPVFTMNPRINSISDFLETPVKRKSVVPLDNIPFLSAVRIHSGIISYGSIFIDRHPIFGDPLPALLEALYQVTYKFFGLLSSSFIPKGNLHRPPISPLRQEGPIQVIKLPQMSPFPNI